jgi:hypothetical protein
LEVREGKRRDGGREAEGGRGSEREGGMERGRESGIHMYREEWKKRAREVITS